MNKKFKKTLLILVTLVTLVFASTVGVYADAIVDPNYGRTNAANYEVVVKDFEGDGYLYLRSGPGTGYEILETIYDGTRLKIDSETRDGSGNVWGGSSYNGKYGYVNLAYTTTDTSYSGGGSQGSLSSADYDVVVKATDGTDYLYLRNAPTMNSDILTTIYDGTVLHITGVSTDSTGTSWGQTSYNGTNGYVPTPAPTKEPTQEPTKEPTATPTASPEPTKAVEAKSEAKETEDSSVTEPTVTKEPKKTKTSTPSLKAKDKDTEKTSFFAEHSTLIIVIIAAVVVVLIAIILLLLITRRRK